MTRPLVALLLSAIMAGSLADGVSARPVSGAVLKKMHGIYHAVWKGKKARVQLFSNGTLRAQYSNKIDVGRWSVRGNVLCVSFRVWTHGKSKCGTLQRKGGWLIGLPNSKGVPRLKIRK